MMGSATPQAAAATRQQLLRLLDPWQPCQPPHGIARAAAHPLQRAFELRRMCAFELGLVPGDRVLLWFGLQLAAVGLAFILGLRLEAYAAAAVLVGLCALLGASVLLAPLLARLTWERHYRHCYWLLAHSGTASWIASRGADPPGERPAGLPPAGDIPGALCTAALQSNRELLGPVRTMRTSSLLRLVCPALYRQPQLGLRARARYAALYDFLFCPQAEFHAALESGHGPAASASQGW